MFPVTTTWVEALDAGWDFRLDPAAFNVDQNLPTIHSNPSIPTRPMNYK